MSTAQQRPGEAAHDAQDSLAGSSRWMTLLKILALAAAFAVVYSQVTWYDLVESPGGEEIKGFIQAHQPVPNETYAITLEAADGTRLDLGPDEWKKGSLRYGLATTFRSLDSIYLVLGMICVFAMYLLGVIRWRTLLVAQGLEASFAKAFRLTFMGFFFNNFMPGMTGGDVAKATLIAYDSPGRRSEAVSTVIVDRVIGLAVLASMSALAIMTNLEQFKQQAVAVFAVLIICAISAICLLSRRVRRTIRLDRILKSLPGSAILMKLDHSFQLYRSRPAAVIAALVLSFFAHIFNIGAVCLFGEALGATMAIPMYFAVVPVVFIASSIPLFPGGWGVRETVFLWGFTSVGVGAEDASKLVLLSVIVGLSSLFYSLIGGIFLFLGRGEKELQDLNKLGSEAAFSE